MGRGGLRRGPYGVDDEGESLPLVVYRARSRADRVRARLEQHPSVRAAALVASTFKLDPVEQFLAEPDPFKRAIRVAAHNIVMAEERRASAG